MRKRVIRPLLTGATTMRIRIAALAVLAVLTGACDPSLDLKNPNAPNEQTVLTDVNGVIALGVGIQQQFSQTIDDYLVPNSLLTDEWGTTSKSLIAYQSLLSGDNFTPGYAVVSAPYAQTYQIARTADNILAAAPNVALGGAFLAGLTSTAKLFKAMALGQAAQLFQALPMDARLTGANPLIPQKAVYDSVIALLESARADVAGFTGPDTTTFKTRVLGTGFSLQNTINAMLARYNLFAGHYQAAVDAANRVNLNVLSTLAYPSPTRNPIFELANPGRTYYVAGLASFVTQAQAGDKRPAYWLATTSAAFKGNPDSLLYNVKKEATTSDEPYPVYLPDEMKLIKAEASARLGDLATARDLINQVRTQTSSAVDEPLAGLPALTAADLPDLNSVLREIAYERRYELYMQGTRLEDMRRLPQPVANTVVMQFLPTPTLECQTNPAATCQ